MKKRVHRLNFRCNEMVEIDFMDVSKAVEAGTADDFFSKALMDIGVMFGAN